MDKNYFLKKPKAILVQDTLYYKGMSESLNKEIAILQKELNNVRAILQYRTCQRNAATAALKGMMGLAELS